MRRMKVYIAGPYTAATDQEVWQNVVNAIDAGIGLYKRGHYPYIPHLTHFVEARSVEVGAGLRWEDYLRWDRVWLYVCDAFLYLASSRGADMELEWARTEGKEIFYRLDDIPFAGEHTDDLGIPSITSERLPH